MRDARVAAHLHRLHPDVLLVGGWGHDVDVDIRPPGRHLEFLVHREHVVRRPEDAAEQPALGEFGWRELTLSTWGSAIDPRQDRLQLRITQSAIVAEMAVARVGMPRWHDAELHHQADRVGPRSYLFIGQQRQWRDLSRSVAVHTLHCHQRPDMFRPRRHALRRRSSVGRGRDRLRLAHGRHAGPR